MRSLATKWHAVTLEDQKRIQCDVEGDCGKPAVACEHVEGLRSVSFFYYCEEHAREYGYDGNQQMDKGLFEPDEDGDGYQITVSVCVSIPVTMGYDADDLPTKESLRSDAIANFLDHPSINDPAYASTLTDYVHSIDLPSGDKV